MTTPFPFTVGQTLTAAQMNAITTLPINDRTASYVALVGDVGKRIVMNVASANTVTINNSVFATGDTIFIANKGAGATTVTAGAGVTINTAGSLVIAQHGGGTLVATSASVFTFFSGAGNLYGVATGGASSGPITVSGQAYTMLTFTASGTLTVTKSGLFDVLLVAGGGGGSANGGSSDKGMGGGGAGAVCQGTIFFDANATVTVGAGGAASLSSTRQSGIASGVGELFADGGGAGGADGAGFNGGSGGGGAGSPTVTGGAGISGVGNNGGTGVTGVGNGGGGGGGAGAVGGNAVTTTGGAGGAGEDVSAFRGEVATTTIYGGGGGGGGGTVAAGGSGGGGAGARDSVSNATAGGANTGGGGGGGNVSLSGTPSGGSGIVLVRFKV